MELSADEVLATLREIYPRELQIAMLTAANRRLELRVAELEQAQAAAGSDAHTHQRLHTAP